MHSHRQVRLRVLAAMALLIWSAPVAGHVGEQAPPPPPRGQVVVLRPADVDALTRTALARVIGELTAARFLVTVVPLDPAKDPASQVETVAPELQPVAAFAIAHVPGSTDANTIAIWVSDRPGRRVTIQRMTMHGGDFSQDAESLAVEAIELIRVSIAGLWPAHVRAMGADAPEPRPVPAHEALELSVGLGVAVLQDVGVSTAQWMGAVSAIVKWPSGVALHAELRGLGPAVVVPGNNGTAAVDRTAATAGAGWVFWSAERVRSSVMVAAGVEHLSATGASDDPARVHSVSSWSTLLAAGAGVSARLSGALALAVELDGIFALPPTVLRIGDSDTRQLSQPGVLVTAGLQARF